MHRYFAIVNTFSNAAGDLVSERLVPEPHVWNDDDVPPMPTDPLPEGYVPIDDGTPKYMAYVPKLADPGFHKAISGEEFSTCDNCGNIRPYRRIAEAQEKASMKRKFHEVALPAEKAEDGPVPGSGGEEKISRHSTAAQKTSSKEEGTVEPAKRSQ